MTVASGEARFKYDVAFSFLGRDEEIATQLADLLRDRFECFIYSRKQGELAGTDGEVTFNRVFGEEARTVVVLYRPGWGETPWTRIEQTAIRNRAYEQSYDFALFIELERGQPFPTWLPKTQLWFGLERWGLSGAASVIEAKVEGSGGRARQESAIDLASRLQRAKDKDAERKRILQFKGVQMAEEEFGVLVEASEQLATRLNVGEPPLTFRLEKVSGSFVASARARSLTYGWQLQWGNTLDGSTLFVRVHRGSVALHAYGSGNTQILDEFKLDFDLSDAGATGWRLRGDLDRFMTSPDLADWSFSKLLKHVFANI